MNEQCCLLFCVVYYYLIRLDVRKQKVVVCGQMSSTHLIKPLNLNLILAFPVHLLECSLILLICLSIYCYLKTNICRCN